MAISLENLLSRIARGATRAPWEVKEEERRHFAITYFNEMKEVVSELLAEWPFKKIVLDTTKHDLPTYAEEIFRHLGLDENLDTASAKCMKGCRTAR